MTKILLVEDDPNLGSMLHEYLRLKEFDATLCANGKIGYERFMQTSYDICIADVMMPVMDGFTMVQKIRAVNSLIPIIFLTARDMKEDKLEGFRIGADDYLTKPFSMEELLMRIQAVLRRCAPSAPATETEASIETYKIGDYVFYPLQQTLSYHDAEPVRLTTKETDLLILLAQHKNDVLERDTALMQVWGNDNYFTARSMDVFITKLRKHLAKDQRVEIINVHSRGYKLIDNNLT
ncbi:MAG: response regulator transcription factor [Chitinophagales bacterium]|jgi:DNA-binding response OmpR family regulator|nr:response regulator transcription factor [Chitinophagales bacterium]